LTFFTLATMGDDDAKVGKQCAEQLAAYWQQLGLRQLVETQAAHSYTTVHVKRWPAEPFVARVLSFLDRGSSSSTPTLL
jgi:hypothetical protein